MSLDRIYTGVCWALATDEERTKLQEARIAGNLQMVNSVRGWDYIAPHKESVYDATYRIKLPKLTLELIEKNGGWPEGAKCAVVSADATVFFTSDLSIDQSGDCQWVIGRNSFCKVANFLCDPTDWRNSKILRPAEKKMRPWGYEEWEQFIVETNGVMRGLGSNYLLNRVSMLGNNGVGLTSGMTYSFEEIYLQYSHPDGSRFEVEE